MATSAICELVRKQRRFLPDTLGHLTSASIYMSMLQTPMELSTVLSDSAKAFSGALESTCSYGGTFRMLWDLTYKIVKFWSFWDNGQDLWETSREAETAGPHSKGFGALCYQQRFVHYHKAFRLGYSPRIHYFIYGMHYFCHHIDRCMVNMAANISRVLSE